MIFKVFSDLDDSVILCDSVILWFCDHEMILTGNLRRGGEMFISRLSVIKYRKEKGETTDPPIFFCMCMALITDIPQLFRHMHVLFLKWILCCPLCEYSLHWKSAWETTTWDFCRSRADNLSTSGYDIITRSAVLSGQTIVWSTRISGLNINALQCAYF